jgi:hypothetical protein
MRRRSNPLSERNIKRIDTRPDAAKQTHGFQVCISRHGKLHTKHFSDSLFGGLKGSLKAARTYRDQMLAEMPEIEASRIAHSHNAKNKSGHVGISYRKTKNAKGRIIRHIAVSVRAERGKTVSRVYAYTKDIHDQVLAEAIAFREEMLRQRLSREGGLARILKRQQSVTPKPAATAKKPAKAAAPKALAKRATSTSAPKPAKAKKAATKKEVAKKPTAKKTAPKKTARR